MGVLMHESMPLASVVAQIPDTNISDALIPESMFLANGSFLLHYI